MLIGDLDYMCPILTGIVYKDYLFFKFRKKIPETFRENILNIKSKKEIYEYILSDFLNCEDLEELSDGEIFEAYSKINTDNYTDEVSINILNNWFKQKDRSNKLDELGL